MLRQATAPSDQLQEEEVRTHEPAAAEEEDKVVVCWEMLVWSGVGERRVLQWQDTARTAAVDGESALNDDHTQA